MGQLIFAGIFFSGILVMRSQYVGFFFLIDGAKDKKNPNIEYGPLVSDLVAKGVKFEVCELTLRALNLKKDQFVMDAGFTPSGVVRIGQLQGQGFGYIKP